MGEKSAGVGEIPLDGAGRGLACVAPSATVEGVGHFFEGKHREVGQLVAAFLAEKLVLERLAGE